MVAASVQRVVTAAVAERGFSLPAASRLACHLNDQHRHRRQRDSPRLLLLRPISSFRPLLAHFPSHRPGTPERCLVQTPRAPADTCGRPCPIVDLVGNRQSRPPVARQRLN